MHLTSQRSCPHPGEFEAIVPAHVTSQTEWRKLHRETNDGTEAEASVPSPATSSRGNASPRAELRLPPLNRVLNPSEGDEKEWSQEMAEQQVDPSERQVECAESKASPKRAKR